MKRFQSTINNIISSCNGPAPLCSFDIASHFESGSTTQKTNAAFLIILAGEDNPLYEQADNYLSKERANPYSSFLSRCLLLMRSEIDTLITGDPEFQKALDNATDSDNEDEAKQWTIEMQKKLWGIFFPEGVTCLDKRDETIDRLREARTVNITQLNGAPLSDPASQLLLTSNILLTIPSSPEDLDDAGLSDDLTAKITSVSDEQQLFYFDHPIQIGVETDKNEVIYGLRGLNDACAFEKERGNMDSAAKAVCVLSVSVTHQGLHKVANEYLKAEFAKIDALSHLSVYIFTEQETDRIINEVLTPAAKTLLPDTDTSSLKRVFGVDGEYGRHYSFLKAIAAFWQVLVNDDLKATFKIDLDQIFPQKTLADTTGKSAFEHYMSPLWGAKGTDSSGKMVELGMLAGALVNESDIADGLYTPDVKFPAEIPADEGVFFMSGLPMALSTQAEMGTRYGTGPIDGETSCIQRVHVTGGTNGILIDSLRKYRPFTPSFIGRAEDQAYLMSVLHSKDDMNLRYFHCDGLIMRHDKYAFAGEAIEAAQVGRQTGDLVRLLYFSSYARSLPWSSEQTKQAFDPFTGCFISKLPITIVMMRLTISMASMFEQGDPLAENLATVAIQRLGDALDNLDLSDDYKAEREAWDSYYDILDAIDKDGRQMDKIRDNALQLVSDCRVL